MALRALRLRRRHDRMRLTYGARASRRFTALSYTLRTVPRADRRDRAARPIRAGALRAPGSVSAAASACLAPAPSAARTARCAAASPDSPSRSAPMPETRRGRCLIAGAVEIRVEFPMQRVKRPVGEVRQQSRESSRRHPGEFREQRPRRLQPFHAISHFRHPAERRRNAAPRFDPLDSFPAGSPVTCPKPERRCMIAAGIGPIRQRARALRKCSPTGRDPRTARRIAEGLSRRRFDLFFQPASGRFQRPVIDEGRCPDKIEFIDQHRRGPPGCRRRDIRLPIVAKQAADHRTTAMQRIEHIVAKHDVVAVRRKCRVAWRIHSGRWGRLSLPVQ